METPKKRIRFLRANIQQKNKYHCYKKLTQPQPQQSLTLPAATNPTSISAFTFEYPTYFE